MIYCAHCGCRLAYSHHHETRKRADGTSVEYDYELYRCYRKVSSRRTCCGQTSYKAILLNEAVEEQVRTFFSRVKSVPHERLVELATARDEETHRIAYRQAEREFEASKRQVTALEEEVVKALTGESQLDLTVANSMLLKHREKLQTAQRAMEEAKARLEKEKSSV